MFSVYYRTLHVGNLNTDRNFLTKYLPECYMLENLTLHIVVVLSYKIYLEQVGKINQYMVARVKVTVITICCHGNKFFFSWLLWTLQFVARDLIANLLVW